MAPDGAGQGERAGAGLGHGPRAHGSNAACSLLACALLGSIGAPPWLGRFCDCGQSSTKGICPAQPEASLDAGPLQGARRPSGTARTWRTLWAHPGHEHAFRHMIIRPGSTHPPQAVLTCDGIFMCEMISVKANWPPYLLPHMYGVWGSGRGERHGRRQRRAPSAQRRDLLEQHRAAITGTAGSPEGQSPLQHVCSMAPHGSRCCEAQTALRNISCGCL